MAEVLTFEGKEFKLHYGIIELDMIEDYHDLALGNLFAKGIGVRVLVTCVWAGISRFQPEFASKEKREVVLQMMDTYQKQGGDVPLIKEKISKALEESGLIPNAKGETPNNP